MEKHLRILVISLSIYLYISCSDNKTEQAVDENNNEIAFISFDIFPALSATASIIFDFDNKIFLIKPNGISSLNLPPPPLPLKDSIYDPNYTLEELKIVTESGNLINGQIDSLRFLINGLQPVDFKNAYNFLHDGLGTRFDIVYKNGSVKTIIVVNEMTNTQRQLFKYLFRIITNESEFNKDYFNDIGPQK